MLTDGSTSAHDAIKFMRGLVHEDRDEIVLFGAYEMVFDTPPPGVDSFFPIMEDSSKADAERKSRFEAAAAIVDECAKVLHFEGFPEAKIDKLIKESADVRETVLDVANETKADMIVVGSRGLGDVQRMLLGSVSSYLVHHAHVPVLVVRQHTN